jgi:hypothetical protein
VTDQPSPADLKQMWGALEDITAVLTEIAAWLPTEGRAGRRRDRVEKALGTLVALEWDIATELGKSEPDAQPARRPAPQPQAGYPPR